MDMQFGFGWGKGRRVTPTTIPDDVRHIAHATHRAWLDRHLVRVAPDPPPEKLRMAQALLRVRPGSPVTRL
jgi:hypothetical protein